MAVGNPWINPHLHAKPVLNSETPFGMVSFLLLERGLQEDGNVATRTCYNKRQNIRRETDASSKRLTENTSPDNKTIELR